MCRGMPLRLQWLTTMPVEIPDDRPRLAIRLGDGSEALLSPLTGEDSGLVEEGLDHLSVESRYTRFGRGLSHLSHSELEYLTNVDQRNHVAWGAVSQWRSRRCRTLHPDPRDWLRRDSCHRHR